MPQQASCYHYIINKYLTTNTSAIIIIGTSSFLFPSSPSPILAPSSPSPTLISPHSSFPTPTPTLLLSISPPHDYNHITIVIHPHNHSHKVEHNTPIKLKVKNAQECGAKGAILYNDPADYAKEGQDKVYPKYIWLPKTGVQRGSIFKGRGDPLTPGLPSVDGVIRIPGR